MLTSLRKFNFWVILIGDTILVTIAYLSSYLIRFEGNVSRFQVDAFQSTVFWIVPIHLAALGIFKLYKGMWRYTSVIDSINLIKAVVSATFVTMTVVLLLHRFEGFSRSVFIINGLLILLLTGGFRLGIRFVLQQKILPDILSLSKKNKGKNLLIVGAGSAGEKLIRELRENRELNYNLVGLIDDDPSKHKQTLHNVPVLGSIERLPQLVKTYNVEEIAIAIPSASMRQMRSIIDTCKKTNAVYKTLPGIGAIIQGKVTFSELRPVRYEDLLKRTPIALDNDLICGYLTSRRIMVTGGAGSIGSELCRQIAAFSPKQLIILERNESALYELVLDLKSAYPELEVITALAAVQNHERMTHIFSSYRPEVVFHAAAYKHVPMMENHPWEAVFNNVAGSRVLLQHCQRFGVERCVLVSTDKAVRPTNVMGATKRLAELLTQSYAKSNQTRYMAVRFGNVLGSVGSVLPLFQKQIAAGGPVTVTDPAMTRFFMTIPEACSLILQCGAFGKGGEIFVLKMGTPVRIDDMARDLIFLSGYRPDEDIEIRYTGLRPGEKLYEELITAGEGVRKTSHEDIMVLSSNSDAVNEELERSVDELVAIARKGDTKKIKAKLREILPEYQPWSEKNQTSDQESAIRTQEPSAEPICKIKSNFYSHSSKLNKVAAEDRLLLQVLSTRFDEDRTFPLEALTIWDWEKIIQSALRHNVASILYLQLRRSKSCDRVPLKISKRLRKIYLYFVNEALQQQYWLLTVLRLLEKEEIQVFLLDGPILGENIYHNIATRTQIATNLIFFKKNLPRLANIQKKINDIIRLSGYDISISWQPSYPELIKEINMDDIWRHAHSTHIDQCRVKIPSLEDLVLHLCLKFVFYHKFKYVGLQTLCDLSEILFRYSKELNWDKVLNVSRNLSVTNSIGLTLLLVKDLLKAPIRMETIRMFGSEDQLSMVQHFAMTHIFGKDNLCEEPFAQLTELWKEKSFLKKAHALGQFIFLPAFLSKERKNIWGKIGIYVRKLLFFMVNCAIRTSFLLVNNRTMLERIRQQQEDSLIWEWFQEKRDFLR